MMLVYYFFELGAFYLGCMLVKKSWPIQYKLLVVYAGFDLLWALLSAVWIWGFSKSNHWITNLTSPIECALILFIFYKAAAHPFIKRINIGLMLTIIPLLLVGYTLYPEFFWFNKPVTIGCLFLILLSSCLAYIDLLLDKIEFRLPAHPMFWLAGGMLLYSISSILCFMSFDLQEKMILYWFFYYDYYCGQCVINLGILLSFILIYLQSSRSKTVSID